VENRRSKVENRRSKGGKSALIGGGAFSYFIYSDGGQPYGCPQTNKENIHSSPLFSLENRSACRWWLVALMVLALCLWSVIVSPAFVCRLSVSFVCLFY